MIFCGHQCENEDNWNKYKTKSYGKSLEIKSCVAIGAVVGIGAVVAIGAQVAIGALLAIGAVVASGAVVGTDDHCTYMQIR